MRSDIIPPNRLLSVALILGLAALIVYGAVKRDPATIIIVAALAVFFGVPALLLGYLNRRGQQGRHPSSRPLSPLSPLSPHDDDLD